MNTILVTGAAGNTGSLVVQQLHERGAHVRAFVRNAEAGKLSARPGLELAIGDLDDPASLRRAMQGVDAVYLLAANSPAQVTQEGNVIEAAGSAGVRHVVKHSAVGADATQANVILRWHGQSEAALIASGLPYTLLRPYWFFQNLFWFAQPGQETIYLPLNDARVAAIDVRDIAEVAAQVLSTDTHTGRTYTLSGPIAITGRDMAGTLATVLGESKQYIDVDPKSFATSLQGFGQPAWMAEAMADLFHRVVGGGAQAAVTADVERLLGRPGRTLETFYRDHTAAFRAPAKGAP